MSHATKIEILGNVGGRTSAQGFNLPDEVRKQYTGYEHDDESGLDYAQARYYNSSHGRFTSVDPLTASASIKNPQTFNRYSYVLNSPYKFTDPLGLISEYAGSACGNRCRNSDGSGGPTPLDDNSWKVWRLSERVVVNPPKPPPPQKNVNVNSVPKTYNVRGKTAKEAAQDANKKAKNGATEKGRAGETQILSVEENFTSISETPSETDGIFTYNVEINDVQINAGIQTILPNWENKSDASDSEQKNWDDAYGQLETHEGEHTSDIVTKRI